TRMVDLLRPCVCVCVCSHLFFFFSSRRRHTRFSRDWSSDVCSSDLLEPQIPVAAHVRLALELAVLEVLGAPRTLAIVRREHGERSEERRVGKEGRSRGGRDHENKKGRRRQSRAGTTRESREQRQRRR